MILVIGSAHPDIIATITSDDATSEVDKIGTLSIWPGGTGCNVATNLARRGEKTALLTILSEPSWFSQLMRAHFDECKIDCRYVIPVKNFPESGFVAHMHNGRLLSAVSCVSLESYLFPEGVLEAAISDSAIVALDANLSVDSALWVVNVARQFNKTIFGTCVSEVKARRLTRKVLYERAMQLGLSAPGCFERETLFELITLNKLEAAKLCQSGEQDLCAIFGANHVVVTDGYNGYNIISTDGEISHYPAPNISMPNVVGAGDAVFAAFCSYAHKRKELSLSNAVWAEAHAEVTWFLTAFSESHRSRIAKAPHLSQSGSVEL